MSLRFPTFFLLPLALAFLAAALSGAAPPAPEGTSSSGPGASIAAATAFATSDRCMACHNGMTTAEGEDLSFGLDWQTSMMANAARDPYWQAAVRREVLDHPESQSAIENECSRCHMPMTNVVEREAGTPGSVFNHLPVTGTGIPADPAHDGVSCSVCHRIEPRGLGSPESFTGGFEIDPAPDGGPYPIYGPFEVAPGLRQLMQSATDHVPTASDHIRASEMCASCHTLITHSLGPAGEDLGAFPEQVPYLEWQHSAYRDEQSCQSCHMPVVDEAPISSVLPQPREGVRRHVFRGGNFFMQTVLGRFRDELGVPASPERMQAAAAQTRQHLATQSATLHLAEGSREGDSLQFELVVENLAGHKLPTAYPSRRAWLHVEIFDGEGDKIFESGRLRPDGSIVGNENDVDASRYEPHHVVIESAEQVQIYEAVLAKPDGVLTTGLLQATQYLKDNRILPRGFVKETAQEWIATHGTAVADSDFTGGSDRVRFAADLGSSTGPWRVRAALLYQPIGYRWAHNLAGYDAEEPARFVRYYEALSQESAALLALTEARLE